MIIYEEDLPFIKRMEEVAQRRKNLDDFFDRFETNYYLFQKKIIIDKMAKSHSKTELFELWEKFKVLEKKTRL